MGYSDIGCYGGEIHTPNINRLAWDGMRFTQFYNTAKCFPTRASLLTGLYAHQTGLGNKPAEFNDRCVTIAEVLGPAGYRTIMSGKWHAEGLPTQRGFDRYYGLTDGCCNFFNPGRQRPGEGPPGRKYTGENWRRWAIEDKEYLPYTPEDKNFYTTDAFTDYAVDRLEEYKGEDKPFLLYVPYTAPHYPLHAWPKDIAKYKGKYMDGWDKLREDRHRRVKRMRLIPENVPLTPRDEEVPAWDTVEDKEGWDLRMAVYAAMIDRMDQGIGRIMDKIRELGVADNTLVMFMSDNGACAENPDKTPDLPPGPVESYRPLGKAWANATNSPYRKYKSWSHEGGIKTPFIACWPSVIKKGGGITNEVGHLIDIMATCLDAAGVDYPSTYKGRDVLPAEGLSLLPVLKGEDYEGHDVLYWEWANSMAVRQEKWKIVRKNKSDGVPWELYDMNDDPTEGNNLADQHPDRVTKMVALYDAWAKRVGAVRE
jgi:arylsulfatase A-like enzyme